MSVLYAVLDVLEPGVDLIAEHKREALAGHEMVESGARTMLAGAIRSGRALVAIKRALGHGKWLPWLEDNFPASVDTAENYMRLARTHRGLHAHASGEEPTSSELRRHLAGASQMHPQRTAKSMREGPRSRPASSDKCLHDAVIRRLNIQGAPSNVARATTKAELARGGSQCVTK